MHKAWFIMSNGDNPSTPTKDSVSSPKIQSIRPRFIRTIIAAVLFATALGAYVISRLVTFPEPLPDFFLALTAAMAVHLLDRLWLFRDTVETLDQLRTQIVGNVASDTEHLIGQLDTRTSDALNKILASIQKSIRSLDAMTSSGIDRIYASREEASDDIREDITSQQNQKIRLIGVSLNDFVLRKNYRLGNAWHMLQECVQKGVSEHRTLDIKILIIDPHCFGAQLRSKGEERSGIAHAGRLSYDVNIVIDELLKLQDTCKQNRVTFECKLYRLPPALFLCLTDSRCYAQQYYFWSSRIDNVSFPLLRFQNIRTAGSAHSIHSELEQHFDWIWNEASVGLAEYRRQWSLGADKGIAQVGIVNVFTDAHEALMRIEYLLANAKRRVSIQGISLHSFFMRTNPQLYRAISSLVRNDNVEVELLFLNPRSDQAKIRGYREWSFENAGVPSGEYFAKAHERSALFSDTIAATMALESMVREIAPKMPAGWKPKLKAGFYSSAPHCFLLRVDDTVLIEQYHYGKLPDDVDGPRIILGKDLPLVEYAKDPSGVFEHTRKLPFALLESHFDFALEESELLPVEAWTGAAPRPATVHAGQ
jgi:hypothetical protein